MPSGEAYGGIAFMRLKLKQGLPGSIRLTNVLADLSQAFSGLESNLEPATSGNQAKFKSYTQF